MVVHAVPANHIILGELADHGIVFPALQLGNVFERMLDALQ